MQLFRKLKALCQTCISAKQGIQWFEEHCPLNQHLSRHHVTTTCADCTFSCNCTFRACRCASGTNEAGGHCSFASISAALTPISFASFLLSSPWYKYFVLLQYWRRLTSTVLKAVHIIEEEEAGYSYLTKFGFDPDLSSLKELLSTRQASNLNALSSISYAKRLDHLQGWAQATVHYRGQDAGRSSQYPESSSWVWSLVSR